MASQATCRAIDEPGTISGFILPLFAPDRCDGSPCRDIPGPGIRHSL